MNRDLWRVPGLATRMRYKAEREESLGRFAASGFVTYPVEKVRRIYKGCDVTYGPGPEWDSYRPSVVVSEPLMDKKAVMARLAKDKVHFTARDFKKVSSKMMTEKHYLSLRRALEERHWARMRKPKRCDWDLPAPIFEEQAGFIESLKAAKDATTRNFQRKVDISAAAPSPIADFHKHFIKTLGGLAGIEGIENLITVQDSLAMYTYFNTKEDHTATAALTSIIAGGFGKLFTGFIQDLPITMTEIVNAIMGQSDWEFKQTSECPRDTEQGREDRRADIYRVAGFPLEKGLPGFYPVYPNVVPRSGMALLRLIERDVRESYDPFNSHVLFGPTGDLVIRAMITVLDWPVLNLTQRESNKQRFAWALRVVTSGGLPADMDSERRYMFQLAFYFYKTYATLPDLPRSTKLSILNNLLLRAGMERVHRWDAPEYEPRVSAYGGELGDNQAESPVRVDVEPAPAGPDATFQAPEQREEVEVEDVEEEESTPARLAEALLEPKHAASIKVQVDTMVAAARMSGAAKLKTPLPGGQEVADVGDFEPQSGLFDTLLDVGKRLRDCPLYVKSLGVLGMLVSSKFLEPGDSKTFVSATIDWLRSRMGEVDGVVLLLDLLKSWSDSITSYLSGEKTFVNAFFQPSESAQILARFREMADKCAAIRSNPKADARVLVDQTLNLVDKHKSNKDPLVQTKRRELEELAFTIRAGMNIARQPPIGFIIVGPPGTGKTEIAMCYAELLKKEAGFPSDVTNIHFQTSNKHQVLPTCVQMVVYNDFFQIKDENLEIPSLKLLQEAVDSTPLQPETASIAEKHSSRIVPYVVIVTTNNYGYVFSQATEGADKLDRRYTVIQVTYTAAAVEREGLDALTERCQKKWDPSVIEYTVGDMKNERGSNRIVLKPSVNSRKFKKLDPMLRYMHVLDKAQRLKKPAKSENCCAICSLNQETVCDCGIYRCPCGFFLKDNELCPHLGHGIADLGQCPMCFADECNCVRQSGVGYAYDWAHLALFALLTVHAIQMMKNAPMYVQTFLNTWYQSNMVADHALRVADNYNRLGEDVVREVAQWRTSIDWEFARNLAAFGAGLYVVKKLYEAFRPKFTPQGATVSSLKEVPKEEVFVREVKEKTATWLSTASIAKYKVFYGKTFVMGSLVTQNVMLVNTHLLEKVAFPAKITIELGSMRKDYLLTRDDWWSKGGNSDMSMMYVPGLPGPRGCIRTLLPEILVIPAEPCPFDDRIVDTPVAVTHRGMTCYRYDTPSDKGDCGRLLATKSGVVIGFHIGRFTVLNKAVAEPITLKDYEVAKAWFTSKARSVHEFSEEVPEVILKQRGFKDTIYERSDAGWAVAQGFDLVAADHIPVGSVNTRRTEKLTATKTKMFDVFGDKVEPMGPPHGGKAILVDGEWKSPVMTRLKNCSVTSCEDRHIAMLATQIQVLDIPVPEKPLEPLDLYRAICGDPLNDTMNPRDNSKSIGRTLQLRGVTKERAFVKEGDQWIVHPYVLEEVRKCEEEIKGLGPITPAIYAATIKDEVYPTRKALAGKGRFFYVGDVAVNLVAREYLLPITSYLMEHPHDSGCVVTMNACSVEWGGIFKAHVAIREDSTADRDAEAFDLRHAQIMQYYEDFMAGVAARVGYSPENVRRVRRIIQKMSYYVLEMEGNYYICSTRLCSGRMDTIIVNCINGRQIGLYGILKERRDLWPRLDWAALMAGKPTKDMYIDLKALWRSDNTGDDNLTSHHPSLGVSYESMVDAGADFGHVFTSGDKAGVVVGKLLTDVTYLKRSFKPRKMGGQVYILAPLAKASIYKSLAYMAGIGPEHEDERNKGACLSAVREMFMHSREEFDEICVQVNSIFPSLVLPSYEALEREYIEGVFASWLTVYAERAEPYDMECVVDTLDLQKGYVQNCRAESVTMPICSVLGSRDSAARGLRDSPVAHKGKLASAAVLPSKESTTEINTENTDVMVASQNPIETPVAHLESNATVEDARYEDMEFLAKPSKEIHLDTFFKRPRRMAAGMLDAPINLAGITAYNAIPIVAKVLNQYMLVRGTLVVDINVTGAPNVLGMYRFYATPEVILTEYNQATVPRIENPLTTSQFPHVDVDISKVGSYRLRLPCPFPRQYSYLSQNDWRVKNMVINPVRNVNGLTPVAPQYQLYYSYEDMEMDILNPQSGEAPSGVISNILGYGAAIAGRLPFKWANPLQKGLEFGSSVAKFFGFSRPPGAITEAVVSRNIGSFAYMSGEPDYSYSLGIDPSAMRSVVGNFPLAQKGETTPAFLRDQWALLITNWTEGVQVMACPGVERLDVNMELVWSPTPLSFYSKLFEYWTGDIEYKIQVLSSSLLRWRIGVVYVPVGKTVPISFPLNGDYLTQVIDVVGSTVSTFRVPYSHQTPFRPWARYSDADASNVEARLVYFSLAPPYGPGETPVYPYVNLWVRGGPNFSVGMPTLEVVDDMLFRQSGIGSPSESTFGEVIDDLTLMSRRFTFYQTPADVGGTGAGVSIQPSLRVAGLTSHKMTYGSYLATAYLGQSGGYCYKVYQRGVNMVELTEGAPNLTAPRPTTGLAVLDTTVQDFCEVRVPDRNINRFRPTMAWGTTAAVRSLVFTQLQGIPVVGQVYRVYVAAADDFVFGGYLGAPSYIEPIP